MNAQRTISSSITRMLAALLLALACLPFVACTSSSSSSSSESAAVKQAIDNVLEPIKNLDASTIESMVADVDLSGLQGLGADASNILAESLEGFDFTVNEVKLSGDTATASITISCKKPSDIANALGSAVSEAASSWSVSSFAPDKLQSLVGDMIDKAVSQTEVSTFGPIEITLHKTDNGWTLDENSQETILSTIAAS